MPENPILTEIDRLIKSWEGEAKWFSEEKKFADGEEKALYEQGWQSAKNVVRDLQQLRKLVDA